MLDKLHNYKQKRGLTIFLLEIISYMSSLVTLLGFPFLSKGIEGWGKEQLWFEKQILLRCGVVIFSVVIFIIDKIYYRYLQQQQEIVQVTNTNTELQTSNSDLHQNLSHKQRMIDEKDNLIETYKLSNDGLREELNKQRYHDEFEERIKEIITAQALINQNNNEELANKIINEVKNTKQEYLDELSNKFNSLDNKLSVENYNSQLYDKMQNIYSSISTKSNDIKALQLYRMETKYTDSNCIYDIIPTDCVFRKEYYSINASYEHYTISKQLRDMHQDLLKKYEEYNNIADKIKVLATYIETINQALSNGKIAPDTDEYLTLCTLKDIYAIYIQSFSQQPQPIEKSEEIKYQKKNGFLLAIFSGIWIDYTHKSNQNGYKGERIYLSRTLTFEENKYIIIVTFQNPFISIKHAKLEEIEKIIDEALGERQSNDNSEQIDGMMGDTLYG